MFKGDSVHAPAIVLASLYQSSAHISTSFCAQIVSDMGATCMTGHAESQDWSHEDFNLAAVGIFSGQAALRVPVGGKSRPARRTNVSAP